MCIELHKSTTEALNAHLACEQDEKFRAPSQFIRETQGQYGERRFNEGHQMGYKQAQFDIANLITTYIRGAKSDQVKLVLLTINAELLEMKP